MKPLYLVLPCYNEEKSLDEIVNRAVSCAEKRNLSPDDFQLLLVENGSKDQSLQKMKEIKATPTGKWIQIVPVSPNRGYGFGVWQGLKAAPPNVILGWSHADEQCDPEDAFKAWEILRGSDDKVFIKGTRSGRGLSERVISRGFEFIASLIFFCGFHEINAQPKVFESSLVRDIDNPPFDFAFDIYVLLKALKRGLKIVEIPVHFPPRKHGVSNWSATFRSKFRNIRKMIGYLIRLRLGRA